MLFRSDASLFFFNFNYGHFDFEFELKAFCHTPSGVDSALWKDLCVYFNFFLFSSV